MALLLGYNDVKRLLTMRDCISVIEQAFIDYASSRANVPLRLKVLAPEERGAGYFMPGALNSRPDPAYGIKIVTEFASNKERGLPSILGIIVLLDPNTGRALAIMDGRYITAMRTGAASGVAAKYLAREDAQSAGILGLGEQAFVQLWAITEIRSISSIRAYSPSGKRRSRWVDEISHSIGAPIEIVASPEEACRDADIIILATNHAGSVIDGDWVKRGAFVNAIGFHTPTCGELDGKTIEKADLIVCDEREAALRESGDIISAVEREIIKRDDLINLGDIVLGKAAGRESPQQITIYRSLGNAFQDLATANYVYNRARDGGMGIEFDF